MSKRVEGIYPTVEEALTVVDRLRSEGYKRADISVVANEDVRSGFPTTMGVDAETNNYESSDTNVNNSDNDDRSIWDKVKDAFTMDETYANTDHTSPNYDANTDPLYAYRTELSEGGIAVLVEEGAPTGVVPNQQANQQEVETNDNRVVNDNDETIELREEKVDVNKETVQSGEIHIGKKIVEDTETIEVPVSHEEVTIERRPVSDRRVTDDNIGVTETDEEYVIPLTEEKVNVDKHAEVVEEVDIHKDSVTEDRKVTENVQHEELDVETTDGVNVKDEQHFDR